MNSAYSTLIKKFFKLRIYRFGDKYTKICLSLKHEFMILHISLSLFLKLH